MLKSLSTPEPSSKTPTSVRAALSIPSQTPRAEEKLATQKRSHPCRREPESSRRRDDRPCSASSPECAGVVVGFDKLLVGTVESHERQKTVRGIEVGVLEF